MSQLARLSAVILAALEAEWPGAVYYGTPEMIYRNPSLVGDEGAYVCQVLTASVGDGISHLVPNVQIAHAIMSTSFEDVNPARLAKAEALSGFMYALFERSRNVTVAIGDYAGSYSTDQLAVALGQRTITIWDAPEFDPITPDVPMVKWAAVEALVQLQPH